MAWVRKLALHRGIFEENKHAGGPKRPEQSREGAFASQDISATWRAPYTAVEIERGGQAFLDDEVWLGPSAGSLGMQRSRPPTDGHLPIIDRCVALVCCSRRGKHEEMTHGLVFGVYAWVFLDFLREAE